MVLIPLMVGEGLIAVLTLYTAAPDGFTADHGRLIQIVAPHLAGAIDVAVRTEAAGHPKKPARGALRYPLAPRGIREAPVAGGLLWARVCLELVVTRGGSGTRCAQ